MKKFLSIITLTIGSFGFTALANASFTDVDQSHPYYEAIQALEQQGVIEGYEDGSFRPEQEIARVEALKIILEGSDIPITNPIEPPFLDVGLGNWYTKYVHTAKELGIVSGDSDTGLFRPGDSIIKAENLKILLEANGRKTTPPTGNPYLDVPTSAWFAKYFAYAKTLALFPQSSTENVQPSLPVTRGLMADLMYQLTLKPEGYQEGKASFYGLNLHGNGTASGERFDAYAMTAAHPTLPFGTMVKVKNLENDKEVVVKINDRGPYADGRIIDLSQAAFETIAPLSQGIARVSVIPLEAEIKLQEKSTEACKDKEALSYLSKTVFKDITLDKDLPNRFFENEVWSLSGSATTEENEVTAFLVDESGKQHVFNANLNDAGQFKMNLFLPSAGSYQLGVLPGSSGTTAVQDVIVLSSVCHDDSIDVNLPSLSNLEIDLREGDLALKWVDEENYELTKVTFRQGEREKDYLVYGDSFTPHYADFEGWQEDKVEVQVQGAHLDQISALEVDLIRWSPGIKQEFMATKHHQYILKEEEIKILNLPETLSANQSLSIQVDPLVNLNEKALIILPNGQVEGKLMMSDTHNAMVNNYGIRVFPSTATKIELGYTPTENEVYFFELNNEEGEASLNIALYPQDIYPLLPNPVDLVNLNQDTNLDISTNLLSNYMLSLVNEDRLDYGLPSLKLDNSLSDLAQMKAEDMAEKGYLSHWNLEGFTVNELRKDFDIKQFVSENIALDATVDLAQYGLMNSASHRMNILKTEWKRAGFGIAKNPEGGYIFVQIFSDNPVDFSNTQGLRDEIIETLNKTRNTALTENDNLNSVSQKWSEKMMDEDFFSLTSPSNIKLVDEIRDTGVKEALGTYLVGNSSFESALQQIAENDQLKEARWKDIGVGISQDELGIIKITLSYTE